MLDRAIVKVGMKTPASVTLRPLMNISGVYRVTVFEKVISPEGFAYRPLAERLIYRKSAEKLEHGKYAAITIVTSRGSRLQTIAGSSQ